MRLDNLTKEQADICDVIWNIPDKEQFRLVSRTWSPSKKNMAQTLMIVMIQEELEEELEAMDSYPLVEDLLIRLKS
ncbi:hypothetical protein [Lentibacter algarum]|uniref:hypothetical protein n=1 Tax=Lentibacter algarum TaxID=576131 RepID=UPI0023548B1C|nr:hypothetical protein [Lentibacter algarum]